MFSTTNPHEKEDLSVSLKQTSPPDELHPEGKGQKSPGRETAPDGAGTQHSGDAGRTGRPDAATSAT